MTDESDWQPSRLIPVSGIRGEVEQERRGCSALLAVFESVTKFGRAVLCPLGAPGGAVSTFVEVPFELGDRRVRPDGVIRVVWGKKSWTALVEVKTSDGKLRADQVGDYLDLARQEGYDLVLTISNEIAVVSREHPTLAIDKKKIKKGIGLAHISWSEIHTEAVIERANNQIADSDQAWILGELVRYLEHDNSGAVDFQDMGENWVRVREGAARDSLRPKDQGLMEVATRFDQLIAFAGLRLSRRLGVEVRPALTKAEINDIPGRTQAAAATLVKDGALQGRLRVPHAAADIRVITDLRAGRVRCSAAIGAPQDRGQKARVRWLLRQLASAPDDLQIEAMTAYQKVPGPSVSVADLRDKPELVILDKTKDIKTFTLTLSARAGTKRGAGRGSFTDSVLDLVELFYTEVVQAIKSWTEAAPPPVDLEPHGKGSGGEHIIGELPSQTTPRPRTEAREEESQTEGPEISRELESVPT